MNSIANNETSRAEYQERPASIVTLETEHPRIAIDAGRSWYSARDVSLLAMEFMQLQVRDTMEESVGVRSENRIFIDALSA